MKFLKRFHWFEISILIALMSISLYAAFSAPHNFSMRWFVRDDAYYYFKVAQNIAEGHGSTFDGINLTNGYHPLWLLICIPIFALARFDLILPLRILLVVMAASNIATSILLFRLLKKTLSGPIAMLAAAYWAFSTTIHSIITEPGMETGLTALSIVTMLYLLQKMGQKKTINRGDILQLTLAALFVLFSRLDSIYLVLVAGVWVIFRNTPIRYLLPADLLAAFVVVILAFVQRATLQLYLLAYTNAAILTAAITFVIQSIVFYLVGLYGLPRQRKVHTILLQTLLGTSLAAILSATVMFTLAAFGWAEMPRSVPLLYWAGITLTTLLTRLAARFISPWPVLPFNEPDAARKPLRALQTEIKNSWRTLREHLKTWLRDASWYYGIIGAALGAYMLFNLVTFGTPMPVSGQIKRWWNFMPNNVYARDSASIPDMFGLDMRTTSHPWGLLTYNISAWVSTLPRDMNRTDARAARTYWLALAGIAALWLGLFLTNRSRNLKRLFLSGLIPLFISAELHIFLYGAMSYAAEHEWYWVMQMLVLVILAAIGLENLLKLIPPRSLANRLAWTASGILSLYLLLIFTGYILRRMPYQDPNAGEPYMDQLSILEGYTEPGALIGMTGGGNAGYYIKDRTIVNMDGLINSYAYFQALKNNQGAEFLANMGLDYVFANPDILQNTMPYQNQFAGRLFEIPNAPLYASKQLLIFRDPPAATP